MPKEKIILQLHLADGTIRKLKISPKDKEFWMSVFEPKRAAEHRNEAEGEQTCPSCSGFGTYLVGDLLETCPVCEGTGHV